MLLAIVALLFFFCFLLIVTQLAPTYEGNVADILTPLFSTATFSLFIIASAIGVLTLVLTFYGREWLEQEIERRVEKRIAAESKDMNAYILGQVGFIFGKLYQEHSREFPELLDNAIQYTGRAYSELSQQHFAHPLLRNNYAFLAALSEKPEYAHIAVNEARFLRESEYRTMGIEDMLTYLQIVQSYGPYFEEPDRARWDAKQIADHILESDFANDNQKERARHRRPNA
jgi:hypothetical protein